MNKHEKHIMAFLATGEASYSDLIKGLVDEGLMAKGTLSKYVNSLLEKGKVRKKISEETYRPVYLVTKQYEKEAEKYHFLKKLEEKGGVEPYLAMIEAPYEQLLEAVDREELVSLLFAAVMNILPKKVLGKALSDIPSFPKDGTPEMEKYLQKIDKLLPLLETPEGMKAIDALVRRMKQKDHLFGLSRAISDALSFRMYSPLPIEEEAELDQELWCDAVRILIKSTRKLNANNIDYKKLELLETKKLILTIDFDLGKYLRGWGV